MKVTVNSKNQITVPLTIRNALGLGAGDHLLASVRDGVIVLVPYHGDAVDQLGGLYSEIWQDEDVQTYLDRERDSWDTSPDYSFGDEHDLGQRSHHHVAGSERVPGPA
ncbi:MAG: AbrB/MazE/SpoVT family DNA-binding domain-containing protein [Thermomicrobiales bacterium]|nr:AbrB/MazE/SpoVT family DNA-binding domain-containing protein [Thermomicrobiales bacterium]